MDIRILFVNERPFNPILGGIERVTDVLTKALLAKGRYKIYYLCGKVCSEDEYSLNYDFPARLYTLPESGLFSSNNNLKYYKTLLDELEIDIVINQRGLNGGFNKILKEGEVKKVCVLHSKPNAQINHNLARLLLFSKEPKEQVKKFIKICMYPYFYFRAINKAKRNLKAVYDEMVQNSDAIILLSENDKKEFLSNGIDVSGKVFCGIPNPNAFRVDSDFSMPDKEKAILYVGRLDPFEKNVLTLIKIWRKLYLSHPDWKLVLVGDGPDRERIVDYIKKYNIKNVYLEGARINVVDYYKKAAFVCLTSFYEGWGMTLTEGMAYGCIPFTFNNYGAASDIIDDGKNGCLIEAFNVDAYVERLSDLMNNDEKRVMFANSAYRKVEMFDVDKVVPKWEQVFEKLLAK